MTDTDGRDGFVRAGGGARIAYQVRGGGRALVLLAGQSNNHHWWDAVREDFHPAHRTVTLDPRGTGASDKPQHGYSISEFADDVIAVLDALGLDRVDLYGTSMGGRVAQWVAVRHPERVRRLVLGCTSPGGPHAAQPDASVRQLLAQPDPVAVREALADLMYTPDWRARNPGPYRTLGDPDMPRHARHGHLVASNRHDAWEQLPRVTAPTLVLHGDADRLTPPGNAHLLADRIPGAALHLVAGARHAYFEEAREEAGRVVREFLA
ncbi:alpha/beta fold hydrolase [Streptomyces sp. Da 82-17]|uniref:alpha/beta fold hydrolase n=1 Tax=Streptomyces sp. Da 82-17 TaxID=3377116 RepID=UPI0038D36327